MPASSDQPKQPPEQAGEHAAAGQPEIEVIGGIGTAVLDPLEGGVDVDQDHHVDGRDDQQERCRHRCAYNTADGMEVLQLFLENGCRRGNRDGSQDHHRRVAEGKEQPGRHGALALV